MHASPSIPRSKTWETLQKSRNLAAIATLTTGLSSKNANVRHLSLKALAARKEDQARRAIVMNWDHLQEEDIEFLRGESKHFVDIASNLLESGSLSEKRAAISVISSLDLVGSMDAILEIVVDQRHALSSQAASCLLEMCERWGKRARAGKDLPSVRTPMLEKLNYQLALFHKHKNMQIVDAWLCLAHWEDSAQRGLISDPRQEAYRSLLQRLETSDRLPVLQLLGGYLCRNTTPKSVASILANRPEPELAIEIAKLLDSHNLPIALKRLRQSPPLACLVNLDMDDLQVGFEIQKTLWLMLAASLDDLPRILAGAIHLSKLGTSEARQVAAEMLRRCRKQEIETLVPAIQASTVSLQQENCLADLMMDIVGWLQSPSMVLKKAAEEFLSEFSLDNLIEQVRHWPTQMCKAMAKIVALVESNVEETLSRELQCPSPKRRMAALQITEMLQCADSVSEWLMPLLDDPRLDVRVRVIDLLSSLGHAALDDLIPELLADPSTDIQDAANRAIRRRKRNKIAPTVSGLDASSSPASTIETN